MRVKTIKIIYFGLFFFCLFISCSKDDNPAEPIKPNENELVLWENVKIIDPSKLELDLSAPEITAGTYKLTVLDSGTIPSILVGDVIIGEQGEGFIRKVTSSTINGNVIVLETTQGRMSDIFKEGDFSFYLDMNGMQQRATSGFSYTLPSQTIYQEGPLSIVLDKGQVDFDPNWFLDFSFNKTSIKNFEISAKNGTLNGNFTATVTASQAITLFNKSSSILPGAKPYKKKYTKWVPATLFGLPVLVPVTVVMELDLVLDYSATINAAITRQATFVSNNTFNLGLNYANGQWNDINSFSPVNNFTLSKRTGNAQATIDLALTPKVSFKLYGNAGPYASVSLKEQMSGSVASPSLDWDFKADVWLKSTAGVSASILDYTLADYSKTWETSKLSYLTPYKIEKVSGDNQAGNFKQQLAFPLRVRVLDNLNKPQMGVPVYFNVSSGGGTVRTISILSDSEGFAETLWILGTLETQSVTVSVKKGDGTPISNSPIIFTANASDSSSPLVGTWKMTASIYEGVDVFNLGEGKSQLGNDGSYIFGYDDCMKDDLTIFNSNNGVTADDGPTKCSPNDPQSEAGTYTINDSRTQLTLVMNGDTIVYEILTLNSTTFSVKYNDGVSTDTYTKQ